MTFFLAIILIISLAGISGNQSLGLRKMDEMQKSLDNITQKLREMG